MGHLCISLGIWGGAPGMRVSRGPQSCPLPEATVAKMETKAQENFLPFGSFNPSGSVHIGCLEPPRSGCRARGAPLPPAGTRQGGGGCLPSR